MLIIRCGVYFCARIEFIYEYVHFAGGRWMYDR